MHPDNPPIPLFSRVLAAVFLCAVALLAYILYQRSKTLGVLGTVESFDGGVFGLVGITYFSVLFGYCVLFGRAPTKLYRFVGYPLWEKSNRG